MISETGSSTILTWYKCCRAGEVKYDNWSEYNFNTYLQCLETQKHQQKVLHTGLNSVLVFNRENYLLCTLFWMGQHNFFGGGLKRDARDGQQHNIDSVFPNERSCRSSETARRVSNFLKNQLPPNAPQELRDAVSAKSLRQGSITEMILHERSTPFDVAGRSGHSMGINFESYKDDSNPLIGYIGARVLAGHKNFSRPVMIPAPYWLPLKYKPSFDRLMAVLLQENKVPEFMRGGRLYRFAQHLACIQIHWYNDILGEYNRKFEWVQAMNEVANRAQLVDPFDASKTPTMILEEWSKIINEREWTENDCVDQTDMGRLTLSKLYQDLTDLSGRMRDLEAGNQRLRSDLRECFSHQRSDIANLEKAVTATRGMYISDKEQHDALMQQVRHLKAKTDFLRSPNKAAMDLAFSAPALKVAPVPSTPTGQKVSSQYAPPPSSGSVVLLSEEQAQLERERYIAATKATLAPVVPIVHHHQHVQNSNGNVFLAGSFSGTTLTNSLMEAPKKPTAEESAAKKTEDFKRLLTGKSSNIGEDGKIHLHFFIKENRENGNFCSVAAYPSMTNTVPSIPLVTRTRQASATLVK